MRDQYKRIAVLMVSFVICVGMATTVVHDADYGAGIMFSLLSFLIGGMLLVEYSAI